MIILIKRELLAPGRLNGLPRPEDAGASTLFSAPTPSAPTRGPHHSDPRAARPTKNTQRPLDAHASYAFQCPCRRGPLVPRTLSNALAAAAGGCDRWSHCNVQHQVYFYNIKMKHLQHTSETVETLATYV
jgi:hypothetical protein